MRKIGTLIRKEILDILRDKKTLIMMVAVPLLLYPLLLIGMTLVMTAMMESQEETMHQVGISAEYAQVADCLEAIYEKEKEELGVELEFVLAQAGEEEKVRGEADAWIELTETEENGLKAVIQYTSTDMDSSTARGAAAELLELYREELVAQWLDAEGYSEAVLYPISCESEDSASASESLGMDIGGSIGLMLIVTILLGAMYPAIDATAGEKERGTLETLLTLPVTNFQMIMSKYISVALFACTTAVISLLSLGGSVFFLIYGIADAAGGEQFFQFGGIVQKLPVLVLVMITTALLISALCMCFCVFAKSFKEANNYITPVMLVIMFASMTAMVPSVQLDYRTSLIPVVNVSLLIKQIIAMQFDLGLAAVTILINFGYSILIIWILAKLYDSEDILFSDGFRGFKLFQKRSEIRPGTVPAVGDVVISVTVLFLLLVYVGSAASVRNMMAGTAVTQLLVLAVPVLVVWYMKSDVKKLFSLRMPKWSKVPGSILLYIGIYCLVLAMSSVLSRLMPESTQNLGTTFDAFLDQPLLLLVLVLAVMPAVGEEILFRGFLFGSFREKWGTRWALLISALVFGAFHTSLVKLLPMTLLGASFACMVSSAGSIYVSMALHFVNNALSMLVMKYPEQMGKALPFLLKESFSAAEMSIILVIGLICAGIGLILLKEKQKDVV